MPGETDPLVPGDGQRTSGGTFRWLPPPVEHLQELLAGYDVLALLGRGGMGVVYKARQTSLNRVVAIKLLPPHGGQSSAGFDFAARFKVEAQAMARLSHPNIVPVHDFGESEDGHLYYVMELVEGTDLAGELELEGRLPVARALTIALAVCEALVAAHAQGVVHRDIKRSNILLGGDGKIKVADFGLAKMDDPATASLTLSGTSMGSQGYAAPEVFSKAATADYRADIYSLGVVLYEMLTGDVPRGMFKLPSEKVPGLDTKFDAIICKAMEEDREERFQSVAEMRRELEAVRAVSTGLSAEAPQSRPVRADRSQTETSAIGGNSRARRKRMATGVAVALALVGVVWLGLAWLQREDTAPAGPAPPPSIGKMPIRVVPAVPPAPAPSVADAPTDAELRAFAAWLFKQPNSTEPTHVGPNQVPDILVEGVARNLRKLADLPAAPFSIARVRLGPLRLDDTERKQLEVMSRIQRLADFRIYGAEDAGILAFVRDRTLMRTLSFKGAPTLPVMNDEALAHLALLTRLKTLRIDCWRGLTGTGFAHLKEKRYLDSLTLIDCPDVTDVGLAEIARFSNMGVLSISLGAGITDEGLAKLAKLDRLDQLTLKFEANAKVTGQGLAALAGCKELDALQLDGAFPGAALEFVGEITSLQELQCWHNPSVTDAAVSKLARLAGLRDLRLGDTRVSGEGFKDFQGFTALQRLRVDDCYITDEGLRAIVGAFPGLISLALSRNRQPYSVTVMVDELSRLQKLTHLHCGFSFKDEHLGEVARLSRLTSLSLQYSFVTDAGIPHLKPMTQLEELYLVELALTDACVPALAELRGLKSLVLTGTKITDKGAAALQKALPDCKIVH